MAMGNNLRLPCLADTKAVDRISHGHFSLFSHRNGIRSPRWVCSRLPSSSRNGQDRYMWVLF